MFIETGEPILAQLWLELQDARNPNPLAKLLQAERDIRAWCARRNPDGINRTLASDRFPVVVWHRLGERSIQATTRLWVLLALTSGAPWTPGRDQVVTMPLDSFLDLLDAQMARKEAA